MNTKKYVIFTDLKDFTYKNALLTDSQIESILSSFEGIVTNSAKRHNIELVKSIGDAYLALWDSPDSAYAFAKDILILSQAYDKKQKIEIKEIWLRVTLTCGSVSSKKSLDQVDYFWECINLGSRMMSITPKGEIFCTQDIVKNLTNTEKYSEFVWEYQFHGILSTTPIYSLTELSDIQKQELNPNTQNISANILKECDDIVFRSSCVAALLSLQPIPVIDTYNIIGVHLYMILKISSKFNHKMNTKTAWGVFLEIISPLSLSYIWLQGISTLSKILLPGIWGYLIAPTSFAVSYALWKIYTSYFYYTIAGQKMAKSDIKLLFSKQKHSGKEMAKTRKKEIFSTGKNFYKEVLSIKWEKGFSEVKKEILSMLQKK